MTAVPRSRSTTASQMPALGLGCLPDPAGGDPRSRRAALADRLPPHRHRRRLRQRARGRRGHPPLRPRPRRGLPRDQDLDQRLRLRRDAARLREERRQARRRPDRPADPAPGPAVGRSTRPLEAYRALETLLADGKVRAIGVSNFMVDHLDALLRARRRSCRRSTRSRCTRTSSSARCRRRRRARHPHPGVVAHRWHHLLPRQQPRQHPAGPGHRRDRRGARQDGRRR